MPNSPEGAPAITPEVIAQHGLSPEEFQKVVSLLGRHPTLTELGIFSVMWSEHCSYKSSRVHLKRLPTRSKRVVQGPGENAGVIDIGDGWACAFKIESHNHPSFLEPYQGAATGVGGILRDIFTMGARPIAVMDSLRFGPIEKPVASGQWSVASGNGNAGESPASTHGTRSTKASPASTQAALHKNHSLLEGVVSGIAGYGNCFGVPNLGGETRFEACYSGNPLVNAFALGLMRLDRIFLAKAKGEGNPVIYVGAKTGRDGIHGATMASEEFREGSEQKRPNVQVADPFLEKLLLEACLEAMETGVVVGIQDMGAAGLTCSTCEMGARGGVGIEIEMDQVPQRETGMSAYEIMLSESQERMLLVAERGREEEVLKVFRKWGLDAVTIGHVTSDGKLRVKEHGVTIAEIPNTALTDDAPIYNRPIERWEAKVAREMPGSIRLGEMGDLTQPFKRLLASANVCSKRWIHQQYDSMVQINTREGPGADAGVVRVKGTDRALAMALDGNSRWCWLDPRLGAMHAVAEAARNVACTGATPLAATNCLNFGNPEKPHVMYQFSQVIDGITQACEELEIPITGGNVSLYNETLGEGIWPTPVLGVVGVLDKVERAVSPYFRESGRAVVLLHGGTEADAADAEAEFGSSEYASAVLGEVWGYPPALELEKEHALQRALVEMIGAGLLESAHDCADGGLAATAAEACFGRGVGAEITLTSDLAAEFVLFGEDATRVLVSCDPARLPAIQKVAVKYGVAADRVGQTVPQKLEFRINGNVVVSAPVAELKDVWESALERSLHAQPVEAVPAG